MTRQKVAVLGPGSWGTALAQVLNDNGHDVCLWGNVPDQIEELNTKHTNTRYFKDIIISENIKATLDLKEALTDVDAILFVVPTKVTRLVAKQVAETLDHKAVIMHASKGLEPGTHERLSTILEEEIPAELRSEIVVVSGPSHAEKTIVRDITLITAASKDQDAAKSKNSLATIISDFTLILMLLVLKQLGLLKISLLLVLVPFTDLDTVIMPKQLLSHVDLPKLLVLG